jgi:soluble P-type ATPase
LTGVEKTVTTSGLAKLFDATSKTIADLAKRDIVKRGDRKGTYA